MALIFVWKLLFFELKKGQSGGIGLIIDLDYETKKFFLCKKKKTTTAYYLTTSSGSNSIYLLKKCYLFLLFVEYQ